MKAAPHELAGDQAVTAKSSRIAFLDYLRIFAFISVLIGHKFYGYLALVQDDQTQHGTVKLLAALIMPLTFGGGAGVVVFFLVSGYIIAHVLQTEEARDFLIKRAFRIYPLYVVAVLSEAALLGLHGRAPIATVLLPQLLLVGDVFNTSHALGGVEWTLRIEVTFYVVMAALRGGGVFSRFKRFLPLCLVLAVLLWTATAPIPVSTMGYLSYTSNFGPLLFIGTVFYLYEKRQVGLGFLLGFVIFVLYQHYRLMSLYQARWNEFHFVAVAVLIFAAAWALRSYCSSPKWVLWLSQLTFAVYLFHNWLFDYLKQFLLPLRITVIHIDVQALVLFTLFCHAASHIIEKQGIRLGRLVSERLAQTRGVPPQ